MKCPECQGMGMVGPGRGYLAGRGYLVCQRCRRCRGAGALYGEAADEVLDEIARGVAARITLLVSTLDLECARQGVAQPGARPQRRDYYWS